MKYIITQEQVDNITGGKDLLSFIVARGELKPIEPLTEAEILKILMQTPELCQHGTHQRIAAPGTTASGIEIAVDPIVLKIIRAIEAAITGEKE